MLENYKSEVLEGKKDQTDELRIENGELRIN